MNQKVKNDMEDPYIIKRNFVCVTFFGWGCFGELGADLRPLLRVNRGRGVDWRNKNRRFVG
jgi:hypothetical protein